MRDRLEPGWQTHLMFAGFDGSVREAGDHLVVRSPGNPSDYWGNFLLYDRLATTTMTLQPGQLCAVAAPQCRGVQIRVLDLPREAPLAVDVDMACNEDGYQPAAYRLFRENQWRRYGAMAAAGMGHGFGAFAQGQMVAGLGLFGRAGVGRFQHVSAHPAWRRRGLCRALVHAACRYGQEQRGWTTLVMCADPGDVAIGIHASLGFARQGMQWRLQRRAPHDVLPG